MTAVQQNDVNLFQEFMKSSCKQSINFCFTDYSWFPLPTTPLCEAVVMNHYSFARELLCAGADVNFADETGRTPLMKAVQCNNVDMFRLFVSHGASAHATPGYHDKITALYAAADHKFEAL